MAEGSEPQEEGLESDVLTPEDRRNLVWQKVRKWTSGQVRNLEITLTEKPSLIVGITGTSRTFYAKQLALHAVLDHFYNTPCDVENNIEVY